MKGYDELSQYGKDIFKKTHKKHLASIGSQIRPFYERNQIESIESNSKEQCIEVYFKHGELVKYTPGLTWY